MATTNGGPSDLMNLVKLQIFGGMLSPGNSGQGSGGRGALFRQIVLALLVPLLDEMVRHFGSVFAVIRDRLLKRITDSKMADMIPAAVNRPQLQDEAVLLKERHFLNVVRVRRVWPKAADERRDARVRFTGTAGRMAPD